METVLAFAVLITAYLIHCLLKRDEGYNDRLDNAGIWFRIKQSVALLYLKYSQFNRKRKDDIYKGPLEDPAVFGVIAHENDWKIELPHRTDKTSNQNDEVAFHGVNSEGACLVVYFTKRPDKVAEIWLYVKLPNGKCYTLPRLPTISNYVGTQDTFAAHGLRIQCLSPLRRWRVSFNGILKNVPSSSPITTSHVKFQFVWNAISPLFDIFNDAYLPFVASAVAGEKWKDNLPDIERLKLLLNKQEQCGHMMGTVSVDDQMDEVYLWGTRHRRLATLRSEPSYYDLQLLGIGKDGAIISVGALTIPGVIADFKYGFVSPGNYDMYPITSSNVSLSQLYLDGHPPTINVARLKANNRTWELQVDKAEAKTNIGATFFSEIQLSSASLNQISAQSICIFYHKLRPETVKERILPRSLMYLEEARESKYHFVTPLIVHSSQEMETLGGKGLSLAKLHNIAQKERKFHVPNGIVVTYESYNELLTDPDLIAQISKLENVAWGKEEGDVKRECERTAELIQRCLLPHKIRSEIIYELSKIFGAKYDKIRYAVRSSAAGEDSEELSSAGQMETYLNIFGIEEIFKNITKCWASQFSYVAVEYKRRNGQVLNSPMAVVVQEMLEAEAAGVMFTCDPVTSNPKRILITSNYGLGESVVSGSSEADTICILRDHENSLTYDSFQVGSKKTKIVGNEQGGTKEVENTESGNLSISNNHALQLADIGVLIEEYFGNLRDIEWTICDKELYILQTRPITSIDRESEFEIKHELDGPFKSEDEYYTKANIGEVFPGATSPLSVSTVIKMFDIAGQRQSMARRLALPDFVFCPLFLRSMTITYSQVIFNLIDTLYRFAQEKSSILSKSTAVSLFGRLLENDDELRQRGVERFSKNRHSSFAGIVRLVYLFYDVYYSQQNLKNTSEKYSSLKISLEKISSAADMYKEITSYIHHLAKPTYAHIQCTISSSLWNVAVLSNLASAHKGWTMGVFSDFALLTSDITTIESADVPSSIEELASTISQHIDKSEFQAMDVKEAFLWMQNNSSIRKKVLEFFQKHGHRCIKEFDVLSKTWRMDPLMLMKSIQATVGKPTRLKDRQLDTKTLLNKIKAPLTPGQKRVLRFVLPRTRKAVGFREASKSLLIKTVDAFRQAFRHLGQTMVKEGRLTDEEHIFFFTLEELSIYLQTRSPRLLSKVVRRHRMFPELNNLKFPEICLGIPVPLQNQILSQNNVLTTVTVKGTPVSQGVVRGRARVVINVEDANSLKQGEILITYSTDIGWSPYFPLLSGLVTEIGGLISHGAVVAREYGLPCLVGVQAATEMFHTGDLVLLDGDNGIIQKINE